MTDTIPAYDAEGNRLGIVFYDSRYRRWGTKRDGKPPTRPQWHDAIEAVQMMREAE